MSTEIYQKSDFLPTTKQEMEYLGWERPDIILFSGDAYVDHPSFGAAVIGRVLQKEGYKVAIIPQPNWRDDLRDFKKLGTPRLFFGVSPGAMDSMVNHYTANRRLRHDDAYTPGGKHGMRPDYPSIVYCNILKELFPDTPIILGGIEASLRRVSHYDYWQDRLRPSILMDSKADILVYGMGEKPMVQLAKAIESGLKPKEITEINQTAFIAAAPTAEQCDEGIILHSYEECLEEKRHQAENFRHVEEESNRMHGKVLWQQTSGKWVRINPMNPPMTQKELDAVYALPYTRVPHPKYKGKVIPAYEMIRHSVTMHRGCFGGCAFCTISAHQGKFISSRSKESILREVRQITQMEDFKGYVSDLGGPSANMYNMKGYDTAICEKCARPSCLHPMPCKNLNNNHASLLEVYKEAAKIHGVKKCFVGSGVRYDLCMAQNRSEQVNKINKEYQTELIAHHVSGRLKVAPEHTSDTVLNIMRKPSFSLFHKFKRRFDKVNEEYGLRQQIIPYFISSHPGCREEDMAELACETKELNFHLEQVQDFTPTPMTVATEIYYTGIHPYTGESIYTATDEKSKLAQRRYFFWYEPDKRREIEQSLRKLHREDLLRRLFSAPVNRSRTSMAVRQNATTDKNRERQNREYKKRDTLKKDPLKKGHSKK
jgi:uncharacterized radical SAM protein YgiQ